MAELCLRFVTEELPRYSQAEQHCFRGAIRILHQLYGETPAAQFGPLALRAVRASMIRGAKASELPPAADGTPAKDRKPWSRSFTNKEIKRVRQLFRYGISWEMVPQSVADALATVKALAPGESEAAESTPRTAVPEADLQVVRSLLSPLQQDVFSLLLLTGARPGEILCLTTSMIDRTSDPWRCELRSHKTAHMGKRRCLFFNDSAQAILARQLKADPDQPQFPLRRNSFGAAIRRACDKAGVTPFVAHQLRHTAATKLVDVIGVEAAQKLLGHSSAAMTHHYSRLADRLAIEASRKLG